MFPLYHSRILGQYTMIRAPDVCYDMLYVDVVDVVVMTTVMMMMMLLMMHSHEEGKTAKEHRQTASQQTQTQTQSNQ